MKNPFFPDDTSDSDDTFFSPDEPYGRNVPAAAITMAADFEIDSFAVDMFRSVVAKHTGNVAFSPACLENLLALLEKGARGGTLADLLAAPTGSKGVKSAMLVESADALFVAEYLNLKQVGVQDVYPVSFREPSRAAFAINRWCRDKTYGLVSEIIKADSLDDKTCMVALNAVYLKGKWLHPFNKERTDRDGSFRTPGGGTERVAMMYQTKKYRYAEGSDWQAVALDYDTCGREGEPGFFIGILPKGDARKFAASLTPEKYHAIRRALAFARYEKTFVALPKMDVAPPAVSLKTLLMSSGLGSLFRGADFSGFSDELLGVDDVFQRCHVMVDEEKTVAAAVTAAQMRCTARPEPDPHEICFDRPFLWAIDDLSSGSAPYFMGLYEKP